MSLRIILADDNRMLRQGLRSLLEREGFTVVGEASNGLEAARLAQSLQPDMAILDLAMPVLNGLAAASDIHRNSPRTRTVLLTMYNQDPYILAALRSGIRGYVLKTQIVDDLVAAIREVAQGKIYLSPGISKTVAQAGLTDTDPAGGP